MNELWRATHPSGDGRTLHVIDRSTNHEPYVVCWNLGRGNEPDCKPEWDWGTYCDTLERAIVVFHEKLRKSGFLPNVPVISGDIRLTRDSVCVHIKGHRGTWYVIDEKYVTQHGWLFLLEHETHGDDAACLIVDERGQVIVDDVWNGFLDYEELLVCEGASEEDEGGST